MSIEFDQTTPSFHENMGYNFYMNEEPYEMDDVVKTFINAK